MKRYISYVFIFALLSPLIIFFINSENTPLADWIYFNSLAKYSWPISRNGISFLDLNICGGVDNFSNPQMWYFSPINFLYLFLKPYWANVCSWYFLAVLGFYYLRKTVQRFDIDDFSSSCFAFMFVSASFFGLHFIEGHIVYRTFFLLPVVYYYMSDRLTPRSLSITGFTLTVMILDGGIYAFFFSLLMILMVTPWKTCQKNFFFNKLILLTLFSCFLLLLSKAVPVLANHADRIMENDPESYRLQDLITAFYNPFLTNKDDIGMMKYRFHEYGLYLGIGLSLLFIRHIFSIIKLKEFYFLLLFFWMATGWGEELNPWSLVKSIPLMQQMHVQSRLFILFFFFFIICLVKIYTALKKTKIERILLITTCFEYLLISQFLIFEAFNPSIPVDSFAMLERKTDLRKYVEYIPKPFVYTENAMSYACYEPAKKSFLVNSDEIFINYSLESNPKLSFSNDEIEINLDKNSDQPLVLNINWNAGWRCENCEISYNEGLIQINTIGQKKYILTYDPFYSPFIFITYIFGLLVGVYGWKKYNEI